MRTDIHIVVCFFFLLNFIPTLCGQLDSLVLGCGLQNDTTDIFGRKWTPDSTYIDTNNSITMRPNFHDPLLKSPHIPFLNGKIFYSETTYHFPINPTNRYHLKLHFSPTSYEDINFHKSVFSVSINHLTLLNNFSPSFSCKALSQAYIIMEYSLASINTEKLALIFKPSRGSFAFVNGIELMQMPELFDLGKIVGSSQIVDIKNLNWRTMYRLNIGGQPISSDSLTRTWDTDMDYLSGGAGGTNDSTSPDEIRYRGMPEYMAPRQVYSSSRSLGGEIALTESFNLTWELQLEANSTYLIRLHFCDFVNTKTNQVVFKILINNQIAEPTADIIAWSGGKSIPTVQDYVIYLSEEFGDQKLSVSLHPSLESQPQFADAILNGLEIFKVSESYGSLASTNIQVSTLQQGNSRSKVIFLIVAGAAFTGILCNILGFLYAAWRKIPEISSKSTASSNISTAAQGLCRRFSLAEIKSATQNFLDLNVIGVGGFGKVYKGVIDGGKLVAVKRSDSSSQQGIKEFQTEVETLCMLRHKHLVCLLGFCDENREMILVYDYMARGTMREHLSKNHLNWKQRIETCIGAARAIQYLHTGARIIHRDLKTTNILLDENLEAKVADFGLSKAGPNINNDHVTTVVKGSFGYLDPEYVMTQRLTFGSDIYAFGVILFEALSSRAPCRQGPPAEEVCLADWALQCKKQGKLTSLIDSRIRKEINPQSLKMFVHIAEKCLAKVEQERPTIGEVLNDLEITLVLQQNKSDNSDSSHAHEENNMPTMGILNNPNIGSENEATKNNEIFSQIVNFKGR